MEISCFSNNEIAYALCGQFQDWASYSDKDNILWKFVKGEWIGKNAVYTKDHRCRWFEDVNIEDIKIK